MSNNVPGRSFDAAKPRLRYREMPSMIAAPLPPDVPLVVDPSWTPRKKAIANTYNRLGGLMHALSCASGMELPVVLAVWYVESGGREHVANRAIIRFENHVLFKRWGSSHEALYDQHFIHGGRGAAGDRCKVPSACHQYRVDESGPFSPLHTDPRRDPDSQTHEYEALGLARRIAGDVALECASFGGAQIMGFNHASIGYASAREMYDAFQVSERYHLFGFFDFCDGALIGHINAEHWEDFARGYNGPGDAAAYADKIQSATADARAILPANPPAANPLSVSLEEVSVNLEFHVELVPQPDKTSCWAGAMAMLAGYKRGASVGAESLAREVGRSLRTSYTWDMLEAVKQQIGLHQISLPSSFSSAPRPEQWYAWLRDYGPLWVTTVGAPSHAVVIDGIRGELTPAGVELHVLNPWDVRVRFDDDPIDFHPKNGGYATWRSYADLSSDFGTMGLGGYGEWRVLHTGRRAQTAVAHALDVNAQLTDWERADAEPPSSRSSATALQLATLAEPLWPRALGERDVRWAADDVSPDYRHLGVPGRSQPFAFTAEHLDALCRANNFDLSDADDIVLFGLRGCMPVDANGRASGLSVRLSEVVPDHSSYKCVIGVWARAAGWLTAFSASTVPNWRLMEAYRQGGERANMLVTGRYVYRVGTHRANSSSPIRGAFRQEGEAVVMRTVDDLEYRVTDVWDRDVVADNIHAGRLDKATTGPCFSSGGCQTIPGTFDGLTHQRAWADFRTAAGLSPDSPPTEDGRQFIYVLLTGREARLASGAGIASLTRLRYGSRSAAVKAIQTALAAAGQYQGATTGEMDPATTMAFIAWQQAQDGGRADGIVTPALAQRLGVTLTARAAARPGVFVPQALGAPGVVGAGRAEIESPLLAREHHLTGPNVILRWNAPPASRATIDVLVHLHGFAPHVSASPNGLDFHLKEASSGVDFSGTAAGGDTVYRERAVLGIIPHGFRTGRVTGGGTVDVYDFPGLLGTVPAAGSTPAHDGLGDVIDLALRRFEHDALEQPPGSLSRDRLILTAHSGGGARLVALLARHDPHEVHLFDALYAPPTPAIVWVTRRIARDAAALAASPPAVWGRYMAEQGGALRAIFLASAATTSPNTVLHDAIECALRGIANTDIINILRRHYRVQRAAAPVAHSNVPRRYGWQLLVDGGAELEPTAAALAAPVRCPSPAAPALGLATPNIW